MSSIGIDPGILSIIAMVISIFAVCFNALTFKVNSQNQSERRHGDIVRIRSESQTRLSAIQNNLFLIQLHFADIKRALPQSPESDLIKDIIKDIIKDNELNEEKAREGTTKLNKYFKQIDSRRDNKTSVMLDIQLFEQHIKDLDCCMDISQKKALELLNIISSKQEAVDEGTMKE